MASGLSDVIDALNQLGITCSQSQTMADTVLLPGLDAERVLDCVKTKAFFRDLNLKLKELLEKLDQLDAKYRDTNILEIKRIVYLINSSDAFFDPNTKRYDGK